MFSFCLFHDSLPQRIISTERVYVKMAIILISGKAGSGKTSIAEGVASICNVKKYAFADALKAYCSKHHNWSGIKDAEGRALLQRVGQEKRAEDPDYWVKSLLNTTPIQTHRVSLIDDWRFPNEVQALRCLTQYHDVYTVKVIRDGAGLQGDLGADLSETALDDIPLHKYNLVLTNNGSLSEAISIFSSYVQIIQDREIDKEYISNGCSFLRDCTLLPEDFTEKEGEDFA